MAEPKRLAVLIDADNAQASVISDLLKEIANLGTATVKRMYGDFSKENLKPWTQPGLDYAIQPVTRFAATKGKNSSDIALVIDAMDLLHSGKFDGFCILSSDGDFTGLATRIREDGKQVFGFGEEKTPKAFVNACDKFTYTEIFRPAQKPADIVLPPKVIALLRSAVEGATGENGWAHQSAVGSVIRAQEPGFDPRTYGFKKLGAMLDAAKRFESLKAGDDANAQLLWRVSEKAR